MTSAAELLKELVAINSVNPDLVPGAAGESEIADFCAQWLAARGFEVHRLEDAGPPVHRRRSPRVGRRPLADVQRPHRYGDACGLRRRSARPERRGREALWARRLRHEERRRRHDGGGGAGREAGLAGDILVACVADEEYASLGTAEVARHFKADAAIVTEPSHLELTLAHKGFVWFDVMVEGRAAHGSRPELGIDAIAKAGHVLVALEAMAKLLGGPRHPILGTGSVHASIIKGGEELSSYPALCRISIERRTIPGETGDSVEAELARHARRLAARCRISAIAWSAASIACPSRRGRDEPIVACLRRHATEALGHAPNDPRRAVLDRLRHPEGGRHPLRAVRRRRGGRACGDRICGH